MTREFDRTLANHNRFATYALAMASLTKAIEVVKVRGADPKALSFLLTGIELLIQQIRKGAASLENQRAVDELLKSLNVDGGLA